MKFEKAGRFKTAFDDFYNEVDIIEPQKQELPGVLN